MSGEVTRFVLATDRLSLDNQNKVTLFFTGRPEWGYWHQLPECWLIMNSRGATVKHLRDIVSALLPDQKFIVYQLMDSYSWAGQGSEMSYTFLHEAWALKPQTKLIE